jgi:hypothetical protein
VCLQLLLGLDRLPSHRVIHNREMGAAVKYGLDPGEQREFGAHDRVTYVVSLRLTTHTSVPAA